MNKVYAKLTWTKDHIEIKIEEDHLFVRPSNKYKDKVCASVDLTPENALALMSDLENAYHQLTEEAEKQKEENNVI